jgi:hypothetical protein
MDLGYEFSGSETVHQVFILSKRNRSVNPWKQDRFGRRNISMAMYTFKTNDWVYSCNFFKIILAFLDQHQHVFESATNSCLIVHRLLVICRERDKSSEREATPPDAYRREQLNLIFKIFTCCTDVTENFSYRWWWWLQEIQVAMWLERTVPVWRSFDGCLIISNLSNSFVC